MSPFFNFILFIVLSAVALPFSSFSQRTYSTLPATRGAYFFGKEINMAPYGYQSFGQMSFDTSFHGYCIDSTRFSGPALRDSVFYFNRMKRDFLDLYFRTEAAVDCDSSHWLGASMIRQDDSFEIYSNGMLEPIYYKTNAALGESWTFSEHSGLGTFTATLEDEYTLDTVIGIVDTAYSISLQLMDNLGQQLDHPFNSIKIKLSRRLGFIHTFDHYHFPNDTFNSFHLCGLSSPDIGIVQPKLKDFYDFNVRDEFHFEVTEFVSDPHPHSNIFFQRRIIDSLHFYDHYCTIDILAPYCQGDTQMYNQYSITIDTATIAIYSPYSQVNAQYWKNGKHIIHYECNGQDIYSQILDYYDCSICSTDTWNVISTLTQGLGETYKYAGDRYSWQETNLVYYKKNGVEYGDPALPLPCFVGISSSVDKDEINVYPNPVIDHLQIQSKWEIKSISLFDVNGNKVHHSDTPLALYDTVLDLHILSSGIYFLQIITDENPHLVKIIKQ